MNRVYLERLTLRYWDVASLEFIQDRDKEGDKLRRKGFIFIFQMIKSLLSEKNINTLSSLYCLGSKLRVQQNIFVRAAALLLAIYVLLTIVSLILSLVFCTEYTMSCNVH